MELHNVREVRGPMSGVGLWSYAQRRDEFESLFESLEKKISSNYFKKNEKKPLCSEVRKIGCRMWLSSYLGAQTHVHFITED